MTKVRTINQLIDLLDGELAWRRIEIQAFRANIWSNRKKGRLADALVRGAITMGYAHWEGFVKEASRLYLSYVQTGRYEYQELSNELLAIAIKKQRAPGLSPSSVIPIIEIVDFLRQDGSQLCTIELEDVISTGANLNSRCFKDLVLTLGLNYSIFETREHWIQSKIVDNRHAIAHGNYLSVDIQEAVTIMDDLVTLLVWYKDALANQSGSKG